MGHGLRHADIDQPLSRTHNRFCLRHGQDGAVAIRQHDIQLSTQAPHDQQNAVKATVTRQVFLGASRDYIKKFRSALELQLGMHHGSDASFRI